MNNKSILFALFTVLVLGLIAYFALNFSASGDRQISYLTLRALVEASKVESVTISENYLELKTKQPERVVLTDNRTVTATSFNTFLTSEAQDNDLLSDLKKFRVGIKTNVPYPWLGFLNAFIPVLFNVVFWIAVIGVILQHKRLKQQI